MHVLREETRRFEMQHHALSEELVCHRGLEPRTSRSLPGRSRSATHTLAPCLGQDGPQLSLPQQKEMLLQKVHRPHPNPNPDPNPNPKRCCYRR